MASVARDEAINCSNPKLDLFTTVNGYSVDVAVLEYAIFEDDGTTVVVARTALDPATDCPTGARLSTGRYSLGPTGWTVPSALPLGTYKITWYFQLTASSPEQSFTEDFEVLSVVGNGYEGYATVSDFRDEGFTESMVSDARLLALIEMQSKYIDLLTGQWFNPRTGTMSLDGRDARTLRFSIPIISLTEVRIDGTVVDATSYRVYARHLTAGLQAPDDRNDPRIVLYETANNLPITLWSSSAFPGGYQNIEVDGIFGYTDAPGPVGSTPLLVKEACMLLVRKKIPLMSDIEAREEYKILGKVMREETRDQRVEINPKLQMNDGTYGYSLTGDAEVDSILIHFMSPISIGHTGGDPQDYGSVWSNRSW